jgi:hypothetical protein
MQWLAQALGEGPTGVLAGTDDGRISLLKHPEESVSSDWVLGGRHSPDYGHCLEYQHRVDPHGTQAQTTRKLSVTCLAATDQVVVSGSKDPYGALRFFRMDTTL